MEKMHISAYNVMYAICKSCVNLGNDDLKGEGEMRKLRMTLATSILAVTMIAGQCSMAFADEAIYQEPVSQITSEYEEDLYEEPQGEIEEVPVEEVLQEEQGEDNTGLTENPEEPVTEAVAEDTTEEEVVTEAIVEEQTIAEEETTAEELTEEVTEEELTTEETTEETTEGTTEEVTEEELEESEEALYAGGVLEDGVEYVFAYKNTSGELIAISVDGGSVVGKKIAGYSEATDNSKWTAVIGSKGAALYNKGTGQYLYYDKSGTSLVVGDYSSKSSWGFSGGDLGYTGGADVYYAAAVEDGAVVSWVKSSPTTSYVIVTTDGENSGGEAETTTSGSGGGSSSVVYNEVTDLDTYKYISLVDPVTGNALKLDMGSFQTATTTVTTGEGGARTATAAKGTSIQVTKGTDGYALLMSDPPGTWNYIYISGGALGKDSDSTALDSYDNWGIDANGGLYYNDNGTFYYLNADTSVTTSFTPGSVIFGGDTAASTGGGGGGKSSIVDKIVAEGPQVINHPTATEVAYEGTGYAAPTYSVTAALPEGSTATAITFTWYVRGEVAATRTYAYAYAGVEMTDTFTAGQLAGLTSGVYPVYCTVSCDVDVTTEEEEVPVTTTETYTNTSATVNFIVCKGIRNNTALTFSDVHEGFDSIGTAISNIMGDEGLIPALIICTGDWANGHYSGAEKDSEGYNTTLNVFISRLAGQAGGISTVYVSGNHDSGEAAITATKDANLGVAEDYNGVGVIYDSSVDNGNAGTSANDEGLIVFGINYENLEGTDGTDYDNIYDQLESFLKDLRDDYAGQLVVISAHAGLHQLDDWGGEAAYNINNANKIVNLLNEYAKTGMNITYLFGHDHSKGESEFCLKPGEEITSVISYTDKTTENIPLYFTYGHAGYLLQGTGSGAQRYSLLSWDVAQDTYGRDMYSVTDGTKVDDLSYEITDIIEHDYQFTEGNGSKWTGGKDGLTFRVNGSVKAFLAIRIDGKDVDARDYQVAEGSTKITLPAAYLKQLSNGTHNIEAEYEGGSAIAAFFVENSEPDTKPDVEPDTKPDTKPDDSKTDVKPADNKQAGPGQNAPIPKTGDTNNTLMWIVIMLACVACIATAVTFFLKKSRKNR